jgi:predicted Zn-dependent protease
MRGRVLTLCWVLGSVQAVTVVQAAASVPAAALVQDKTASAKTAAVDDAGAKARALESQDVLMGILADELAYTMEHLQMPDGTRPYFVAYSVRDEQAASVSAALGALVSEGSGRNRRLDVDVRVGDYALDNSHKLRQGGGSGFSFGGGSNSSNVAKTLSLADDPVAIRREIWLGTDQAFKNAVEQFQKVQTNLKTMVEEEDKSNDFTKEAPSVASGPEVALEIDLAAWQDRLRRVSAAARDDALVYDSGASISASAVNRTMVTSEGTRLKVGERLYTIVLQAETKAEDGMELSQVKTFSSRSEGGLPDETELAAAFEECLANVLALREAPLVEPYTGPAILVNRASGVFFHEIFGHRVEGHRQKDVEEGQTFTKKIGQAVLPAFLDVRDDPTTALFGEHELRGHYAYDDEGVAAQDVMLVDDGVLKTFLLSRTPVQDFGASNGHGRRMSGREIAARQGNLIVESKESVPFERLHEMLIEECTRQGKPYGLLFEDISGGFTTTRRAGPQAFKVLPVMVWRVYADGRENELVRGVDIVGTPLACFTKIIATGDDPDVFNGTCGAESGWVPVAAISPSILVSEIEVEKRRHEQDRPPILPAPLPAAGADGKEQP